MHHSQSPAPGPAYELDQIDVIELNEAFAAQSLAVIKLAGLDPSRINPKWRCNSIRPSVGLYRRAKLTAQILRELERRQVHYAMVTMCIGGGQWAPPGIFERIAWSLGIL